MTPWRRRMMLSVILALNAYLWMSGIADVHLHRHCTESLAPGHTATIVHDSLTTVCPICVWHALVVAACPRVVIIDINGHTETDFAVIPARSLAQLPLSTRSRAPPIEHSCPPFSQKLFEK